MTFATESAKSDIERFMLVRITPSKYMGAGTSIGSSHYTYTVTDLLINTVKVNGTVAAWALVGTLLTVTSASDLTNLANVVVVEHNIYLTGTKTQYTDGSYSLPAAEWKPLIKRYPTFSQSMRNIVEGIFSLSSTSLELICTDRWAQNILGENDSLSNSDVTIWSCLSSLANNVKLFDGSVTDVSYQAGTVTINVADAFMKMSDSASFGTKSQSHVYNGNTYSPSSEPDYENQAIPLTMGRSSPFAIENGWRHCDPFGSPNSTCYHLSKGQKAVKVSPASPSSTSTIKFLLGRVIGSDVKRLNFGSITAAYAQYVERSVPTPTDSPASSVILYEKIIYLAASSFNGEIGDYIPQLGGWVCGYNASGLWSSYTLAVSVPSYNGSESLDVNIGGNPSGSIAVPSIPNNTIPSVSVWTDGGADVNYETFYYSLALVPYDLSAVHSSKYLKFTINTSTYALNGQNITLVFADVVPSTNGLGTDAQPNSLVNADVKCRISPADSMTHANALKFIVQSSGMTANSASFTTADSELTANVSLTLPLDESTTFGTYLEAAQLITSSTLGILRVNIDREVEYEVIKAPSTMTVDSTRDQYNMLRGNTSMAIQYQDIATSVSFENKQLRDLSAIQGTGSVAFVENVIAKYLHKIEKTRNIEHCLDSIQTRKAAIAAYINAPTVEYNLSTASIDLVSKIGDVIEITNTAIANTSQVARALIISMDQSSISSTIKLNEIRGVT